MLTYIALDPISETCSYAVLDLVWGEFSLPRVVCYFSDVFRGQMHFKRGSPSPMSECCTEIA